MVLRKRLLATCHLTLKSNKNKEKLLSRDTKMQVKNNYFACLYSFVPWMEMLWSPETFFTTVFFADEKCHLIREMWTGMGMKVSFTQVGLSASFANIWSLKVIQSRRWKSPCVKKTHLTGMRPFMLFYTRWFRVSAQLRTHRSCVPMTIN